MMPDYMEALVSQLGLLKVLTDLRTVVIQMAQDADDGRLWLLEQDLSLSIQELSNEL